MPCLLQISKVLPLPVRHPTLPDFSFNFVSMRKSLFFIATLAISGSAMSDTVIGQTLYQSVFGNRSQVIDGKVIRIADGDTVNPS